jgi:phage-related protein
VVEEKDKLNDYQKINEWLDKKKQVTIKFNYIKDALLKKDEANNDTNNNFSNNLTTHFDIENCHYDDLNFLEEVDYIQYILEGG